MKAVTKKQLREAVEFAIYVIKADQSDWSDHGGTTQTHREYLATLRALADRLASEDGTAGAAAGAWVPWKPGDALPATAPVLHWTTWFDKEYTDEPAMRANYAHDFERWGVIAYWSIPLPPPYTPSPPEGGRT